MEAGAVGLAAAFAACLVSFGFFVFGFSAVFVSLGASATLLGRLLQTFPVLGRIG